MNYDPSNPLIVQGDRSVLVEVDNPRYAEARDALAPFAELEKSDDALRLVCEDLPLLEELARQPRVREFLGDRLDPASFRVEARFRGVLKQALIAVGYPAEDLAGYTEGADLPIHLRNITRSGLPFVVRDY